MVVKRPWFKSQVCCLQASCFSESLLIPQASVSSWGCGQVIATCCPLTHCPAYRMRSSKCIKFLCIPQTTVFLIQGVCFCEHIYIVCGRKEDVIDKACFQSCCSWTFFTQENMDVSTFLIHHMRREVKVKLLSRDRLFATPWTVAHQAPPSMGFSRQEYWSGVPFPSPEDLPNPEIKPGSPALQADTLPSELSGNSI